MQEVGIKEYLLGGIYRKYGLKSTLWSAFTGSTALIVPTGRLLQELRSKKHRVGSIYRKYRVKSTARRHLEEVWSKEYPLCSIYRNLK